MGRILSYSSYTGLDPLEQGMAANSGYGIVEDMRCHAVESGGASALSKAVSVADTVLFVDETSRWPEPPFTLQAGAEQIKVTGTSDSTITVDRGHNGTVKFAHPAGRMLYEVRDRYVYLVADHPAQAIARVYVDGSRQLEGYAAYTGQAGNELAGYEGRAVLVFDCSSYVGRQFNVPRTEALSRAMGTEADASPLAWSSPELVDGTSSTFALARGADARPTAWVAFEHACGSVLGQSYSVDVENPSSLGVSVAMVIRRMGVPLSMRRFVVPAGERTNLIQWRGPGQADDELVLIPMDGQLRVFSMTKSLTLDDSLEPEPTAYIELPPVGLVPGTDSRLSALGRRSLRADYPAGPQGTVRSERHYIKVTEATGTVDARIRIIAGNCVFKEAVIKAGESEEISLRFEGGEWQTHGAAIVLRGEVRISSMGKRVEYYPASTGPAREAASSSSACIVVGQEVRVDAGLAVDTDGSYLGAGTLIERPDHVIRHFLLNHMDFIGEDIDTSSFDEAGVSYASQIRGGYKLAFLLVGDASAPDVLLRMAQESRSTVNCDKGKWELSFLPDTAPTPMKTISGGELAGEGAMFFFERMSLSELANTLVAKYGFCDGRGKAWLGVATASDSSSVVNYGEHRHELELAMIRDKATAESVLGHMLKQRATPLMTVTFPVFYEHFDLRVGDTIEIDNPLYGGHRFYIESIRRIDRFSAEIKAIEWWM
jgi:hypothetical protein